MTTTLQSVRCWHFAAGKLRDGRPLPKAGDTLTHEGEVVPCESGLHGSVRAIDALGYAPGAMVAFVELRGTLVSHGDPADKYVASERHYLTDYVDATNLLHRLACWYATQAMDGEEATGRKVDPRSREAIRVKLAWLEGKATDAERAVARGAAWAAGAAAGAAWGAAAAAWAAAGAAWAAARGAAWAAGAAEAAAGGAAWAAQNAELERLLNELMEASK